jgi:quercetin dioxygenase-like cupin family protein
MKNANPWIEICPGIKRQTIASGQTMYQMVAELTAGSKMPEHQHPQEQVVHILSGRMKLIVQGTFNWRLILSGQRDPARRGNDGGNARS